MALALLVQAVLLVALAVGLVALARALNDGWWVIFMVLFVTTSGAALGMVAQRRVRSRRRHGVRRPTQRDRERVAELLTRLCLVAGIDVPRAKVHGRRPPLAWTETGPRRRPTVNVTTGLLDALEPRELEAVIAHELAHLAHRDAAVMAVLTGPPRWFIDGVFALSGEGRSGRAKVIVLSPVLLAIPALLCLSGLIVSRHRELAADRTAALITGSPAAVAAAIIRCRDGLTGLDRSYWRGHEAHEALHFAQLHPPTGVRRLWSPQPRDHTRLRHLEAMEAKLQRPRR